MNEKTRGEIDVMREIDRMVARLVAQFDPDEIILFGSQARGTAGPDSDVDLLVIMPVAGSKREKRIAMRAALYDIPIPKDVLLATPQEVADQRHLAGTLLQPALEEGRVLYARR